MKLDEIKKLIERSEFEVSSKVDTLIAEGLFTFADLSNTILTARDIAKREKDELVEAVMPTSLHLELLLVYII